MRKSLWGNGITRISRDEDGLQAAASIHQFERQVTSILVGQDYIGEQ